MHSIIFLLILFKIIFSCPDNCLYCLSGQQCSACKKGYILSTKATCLSQPIPNCRVQLNSTQCSICQPTFQVFKGQCAKDYSGCVLRNIFGQCSYCWFGMKLNGKACSGFLNCEIISDNKCLQCSQGYSLNGGICVETRSQCQSKSATGLCNKCIANFTLNGFTCCNLTMIPPFCSLLDSKRGLCLICNEGYELYHQYCQRKDYLPFFQRASLSGPQIQSALAMSTDILSNSDTITNNISPFKADFISQDYTDIEIKAQIGIGKINKKQVCWEYDKNGVCTVCIEGYYLLNQACIKRSPSCLQFDSQGKLCLKCRNQLQLKLGNCLDTNCAIPIFNRCTRCLNNYYPNNEGICLPLNCLIVSEGNCSKCNTGFILSPSNICIKQAAINKVTNPLNTNNTSSTTQATPSPPKISPSSDSANIIGCEMAQNGQCLRCGANYFPNGNGKCKRVIIGCLKYDFQQLNCLQCIPIYTSTSDGGCIYQEQISPITPSQPQIVVPKPSVIVATTNITVSPPKKLATIDENCKIKNNGSCAVCKPRYVLNLYNFSCLLVPKECLTYNQKNGDCLSCANGFTLFQIWCLPRYNTTDLNCGISNINNYCIQCKINYYINRGKCSSANQNCKTFNTTGGDCLTCYSGYTIYDGQCIDTGQQSTCFQYDFQQNCLKCIQRYFLQGIICTPVNPLCNNFYSNNGSCIDCVGGYGLSTISNSCQIIRSLPINCKSADPVGNCLSCMTRFYFTNQNTCLPIPSLCSTYMQIGGKCLTCFSGYLLLQDNSCVANKSSLGCLSADSNGLCTSCSQQFILNSGGKCSARDVSCTSYDESGSCNSCASLHYLSNNGKCIKQTVKIPKDPNCIRTDIMNYCLQCNPGFYIYAGNCLLADQQCKTFDPLNGNCLTCYSGYRLNSKKCYLDNPVLNCKRFSGLNCAECLTNFTVGVDGSCIPN